MATTSEKRSEAAKLAWYRKWAKAGEWHKIPPDYMPPKWWDTYDVWRDRADMYRADWTVRHAIKDQVYRHVDARIKEIETTDGPDAARRWHQTEEGRQLLREADEKMLTLVSEHYAGMMHECLEYMRRQREEERQHAARVWNDATPLPDTGSLIGDVEEWLRRQLS